jgi:hypothetical protein
MINSFQVENGLLICEELLFRIKFKFYLPEKMEGVEQ